jgi:3-oxoacyl-[acyl-carrier protein] reductase
MADIVITGTSRGIGLAVARVFLEQGNHRVVGFSGQPAVPDIVESTGVRYFHFYTPHCEGINFEALHALLDREGIRPGILINNAGMMLNRPWDEITDEAFEEVLRVNLIRPFSLIRGLAPRMIRPGHIVNITSMGGVMGSVKFPGLAAYSAAKGGLNILTEALAEELKEGGIRVNALALGSVQTEMLQEAFPGYQSPVTPAEMARYIVDFALNGHRLFNGKVLQVAVTVP